jgi:hypothetical protein
MMGSLDLLASGISLALLGALFCRRLVLSGYPMPAALGLSAFALAQAGIALSGPNGWISLFVALIVYAVGAGAAGFARRQDARSVILMGGSLAGAQAVYPVGGFLAIFLVPALVGLARGRAEPGRSGGLLVLLFFAPCVAALCFAYFADALHFEGARLLAALGPSRNMLPARSLHFATLAPACVMAGIMPAIAPLFIARTASGLAICAVAAALTVSFVLAALIGAVFTSRELSVIVAPLCVLAVSAWPVLRRRAGLAFAACAVSAVASWSVAIWAAGS